MRQFDTIPDSEGRTPLHWAVDRGHLDVVESLISRGADVNSKVILTQVSGVRSFLNDSFPNLFSCTHGFPFFRSHLLLVLKPLKSKSLQAKNTYHDLRWYRVKFAVLAGYGSVIL